MLLAIGACLALGNWQLQRAGAKERLLAERAESGAAGEWTALHIVTLADAHQRLRLQGRFLNRHGFFLDNRTRNGRAGFEVITPFRDAASKRVVLVNRGWLPFAGARTSLPEVPPAEGPMEIHAEVYGSPRPLLGSLPEALAAAGPTTAVVPYVQADIIGRHFGLDLEPYVLRLRDGSAGALQLDWPVDRMGPDRHRGYAVQWFSLALVFTVLTALAWRARRRESQADQRIEEQMK